MPRHNDRQDLLGEHPFGDKGQLLLLIIFLVVWVSDTFVLKYTVFIAGYIPFVIRISLSLIIFCLAVYLAKTGHDIVFGEIRDKPVVIQHGIFRYVRHPLYLAAILFYTSLAIFSCSVLSACVLIVIMVFYNYIAGYEEQLLLERLDSEYTRYMEQVNRWIPVLRKR